MYPWAAPVYFFGAGGRYFLTPSGFPGRLANLAGDHFLIKRKVNPSMRSLQFLAVFALAGCTTALLAQPVPAEVLKNVAQLSASGSVEVQQDMLSISMSTTRDGADAAAVQTQLKQALDSALAQARQAAVPGQMDVRTGNFSLYPRYGNNGKINGWQGSTELVLEGRDFPRITSTAGKIQSLTLGNVSFALSREQRTKVEAEAQSLAIERFKAKAGEIAKNFGFEGYTLREVSINANDQAYMPRPRVMAMSAKSDMAEAAIPVEAGKSTVQVHVSGSVQMTARPARP
jgi:predicted secreted protein